MQPKLSYVCGFIYGPCWFIVRYCGPSFGSKGLQWCGIHHTLSAVGTLYIAQSEEHKYARLRKIDNCKSVNVNLFMRNVPDAFCFIEFLRPNLLPLRSIMTIFYLNSAIYNERVTPPDTWRVRMGTLLGATLHCTTAKSINHAAVFRWQETDFPFGKGGNPTTVRGRGRKRERERERKRWILVERVMGYKVSLSDVNHSSRCLTRWLRKICD